MTQSEPGDVELLAGWGASPVTRGCGASCLGAVLMALGQAVSYAGRALQAPHWVVATGLILTGAGVAVLIGGSVVSHVEERRVRRRQKWCLQALETRHRDADALVLYSGRALPHGGQWHGLVVLSGAEGTLTALASQGVAPVRNARALLRTEDVENLKQWLNEAPKAKSPTPRVMDGFRARAQFMGRQVPRGEVAANLAGVAEADLENPIVRLLGTLSTTCQQITGLGAVYGATDSYGNITIVKPPSPEPEADT
jgi:hypothetical protein